MAVVRFVNGHSSAPFSFLANPFFNQALTSTAFGEANTGFPAVNILENKEAYLLEIGVPGFDKEDFQISLDRNVLTISSKGRSEDQSAEVKYHQREFGHYAFERRFKLPETIDADLIQARCQHGVLQLHIPKKAEAQQKSVRIVEVA